VTHELARVFQIVHKVAMLHDGVILTMGTPEEILSSDNPTVQQFVADSVGGPMAGPPGRR
jgi:ABC-type transporter Mla maintaining outer membrane lipid asymmetry ATPase subunit MlaF